jgi:hypothetical protein
MLDMLMTNGACHHAKKWRSSFHLVGLVETVEVKGGKEQGLGNKGKPLTAGVGATQHQLGIVALPIPQPG